MTFARWTRRAERCGALMLCRPSAGSWSATNAGKQSCTHRRMSLTMKPLLLPPFLMTERMEKMSLSGHQSARAKSVDWLTPPEWISALGPFDLDPCCPLDMPWETARKMVRWPLQDGLSIEWQGRVWMNPPFGQEAAKWLKRLAEHGNGIALIPARTETAMFYESVWGKAHSVCFVKGRPHFHTTTGSRAPFNSGAPIALVAYGQHNTKRLMHSQLGALVFAVTPSAAAFSAALQGA